MKIQIQQIIMVSLASFAALSAVAGNVSLGSILAPVNSVVLAKPQASQIQTVKSSPTVERKLRIDWLRLDDVLAHLEHLLSADLSVGSTVSLASRSRWNAVKINESTEWDVELHTPFAPDSRGRWYPSINLLLDGEVISKHRLTIDVALFRKVWMVEQRINRGVALDTELLKPVVRDIFAARGLTIATSEDLSGYELDRSVARGALLAWDDLRQQPHVRRNALVDVLAQSGSITVRMRGRCMEDGVVGDLVTIRNIDTNREFSAQVASTGTVRFEL